MTNISLECREALTRAQPTTVSLIAHVQCSLALYNYFSNMNLFQIGEAKRIPGVTPAALLHIIHHIKHYTY